MKRVFVSMILVLMAILGFSQTVGDAIYFYRNDGDFNAFFRENIDSITYSNYDVDSIYYDEIMTQVIYTSDSVYRIPLAVIDSVSFVNPEIIYHPDVVKMDNILIYLNRIDGMTLFFDSKMPESLRPQKGKVLLATIGSSDILDNGFIGRIVDLTTEGNDVIVSCEKVDEIGDVVQQMIGIEHYPQPRNMIRTRGSETPDGYYNIEEKDVSLSLKISAIYSDDHELNLTGSLDGSFHGDVVYFWNGYKFTIGAVIYHTWSYSLGMGFKCSKSLEWPSKKDIEAKDLWDIPLPTACPLFQLKVKGYPFVKLEGNIEMSYNYVSPKHSYHTFVRYKDNILREVLGLGGYFDGCRTTEVPYNDEGQGNPSSLESEISFNGTLMAGGKVDISLGTNDFIKAYLSVNTDIGIGPKMEGDFNVKSSYSNPDEFYSMFKDSHFGLGLVTDVEMYGEAKFWNLKPIIKATVFDKSFHSKWHFERYLLPEFKDLVVSTNANNNSATVSTKLSRDLFLPVSVGIGLYDSDKHFIKKSEFKEYSRENQEMTISQTFTSLSANETYTAVPLVKLFVETPAEPIKVFRLQESMPKIISCKMGGSQASTDGFIIKDVLAEAAYECKKGEVGWGITLVATIDGKPNQVGMSEVIPSSQKDAIHPKMSFAGAIDHFNLDYDTFTATWKGGPIQIVPFIDYEENGETKRKFLFDAAIPFDDEIIYQQEPMLAFRDPVITDIELDGNTARTHYEATYGLLGAFWLERIKLMNSGSDFYSADGGWALDDFMDGLSTLQGVLNVTGYNEPWMILMDLNLTQYMRLYLCNGTTRNSENGLKFSNNGRYVTGVEVVDLSGNLRNLSTRTVVSFSGEDVDNQSVWQTYEQTKEFMETTSELVKNIKENKLLKPVD